MIGEVAWQPVGQLVGSRCLVYVHATQLALHIRKADGDDRPMI